jgi:hypothetical protein
MNEELLFSLKIDGLASENTVKKVADEIERLTEATKEQVEADQDALKQKELNEKAIEKQTEALNKSKAAIEAEEGSIKKLREENKKLTEQRNATTTKTEEGRKKIMELNSQLDKNNEAIRANVDAYTKQRTGIERTITGIDQMIPGTQAATQGIWGMVRASIAFIATPIGAILAALGVILLAVTSYFKGSEEGGDKWAKVMAQVSAITKVLTDRLMMLGDALVSFFSGDWSEGAEKMEEAFKGIGDEMAREVALAAELADILDHLEEMELRNSIAISKTSNEIKNLLIQSKDRTKTERERIALQQQAFELEKKQAGETQVLQLARLNAVAQQMQMDFSQHIQARGQNEELLDFVNRIISNEKVLYDKRKELGDLLIAYNRTQGESLNVQEKILNMQDALAQKAKERAEKEAEASEKEFQAALKRKSELEKMDKQAAANEAEFVEALKQADQEIIQAEEDRARRTIEIGLEEAQYKDQLREEERQKELQLIEDKKAAFQASSDFVMNLLAMQTRTSAMETNAQLSQVKATENKKMQELDKRFKAGLISEQQYNTQRDAISEEAQKKEREIKKKAFESQKKNQIAATIISTLQSAVNAFQSLSVVPIVGPILGAAAAAAALVFGYKQVNSIRQTEFAFAGGGKTLTGKRIRPGDGKSIYRPNGDNMLATVKTGEVILNERQQAALGGEATFRAIGVPGFAGGGISFPGGQIETRTIAIQNDSTRVLQSIVSAVENQPPKVLVLEEFESVQSARDTVVTKSTL